MYAFEDAIGTYVTYFHMQNVWKLSFGVIRGVIQSIFMTSVSVYFYIAGRLQKNKIFGNKVISCM